MAGRYSVVIKKKALKRVEKLLAEGKSVNAACTVVAEQLGQPSVATLAGWAKDAGLAAGTPAAKPAEPSSRRRRASTHRNDASAAEAARSDPLPETETVPAEDTETDTAAPADAVTPADPEASVETEAPAEPAADTADEAQEDNAGEKDAQDSDHSEHNGAAKLNGESGTLVRISNSEPMTLDSHITIDDLVAEIRNLRAALNDANEENRALRNLVSVYVSR
ncbi:hypothetical protein [Nocardia brevicatena]|uniref:hypothetical protein n=1 Tax=Nocardia brevicatena TaxID=37327 RepID=UPI00031999DF|nr:hypothetical protein [Nocardia brevicatena]